MRRVPAVGQPHDPGVGAAARGGHGATPAASRPSRSCTLHAANTIARHGRRGWRLDKPDERTPNDAIVALCMAVESVENRPAPARVLGFV